MYRGMPCKDQLLPLSEDAQKSLITGKKVDLEISKIKWKFKNLNQPNWTKIKTVITYAVSEKFPETRSIASELEGTLRKGFR